MSETDFEDYEGEGLENGEESLGKVSRSVKSLSIDSCEVLERISEAKSDASKDLSGDSYEQRKKELLIKKWLAVTGKRPRNIPRVEKYVDDHTEKFVFFGDRKPADVEKRNRQRFLATIQEIKTLNVKFGKTLQEIRLPAQFNSLTCLRFHPGGDYLAVSYQRGRIQKIKIETGEQVESFSTLESEYKSILRTMKFLPNDPDKLYLAGEAGIVHVINPNTGERRGASEARLDSANNMDFSADCSYMALAGKYGRVTVLDPVTLQIISDRSWPGVTGADTAAKLEEEYHQLRVYGLKFYPHDVNVFATGGWDNTIKIWDVRTTPAIRCLKCHMINGDGLDFSGNTMLTVSWKAEHSINIWDFLSGKRIKTIPLKVKCSKFDGEFLYNARFFKKDSNYPKAKNNLVALSGTGFNDLAVLNIDTEAVLQYFHALKPIRVLDILGSMITYGGKESLLRVAELT